jgi:hypothetical protein
MKKAVGLRLRILKSLYPRANLDTAGEGFTVTYTEYEANKLVEDSAVIVDQIVEIIPVVMS